MAVSPWPRLLKKRDRDVAEGEDLPLHRAARIELRDQPSRRSERAFRRPCGLADTLPKGVGLEISATAMESTVAFGQAPTLTKA